MHFEKTQVNFSAEEHALTTTFFLIFVLKALWFSFKPAISKRKITGEENLGLITIIDATFLQPNLKRRKETWHRHQFITSALWQVRTWVSGAP